MPDNYQIGGEHYTNKAIQPWDAMASWMSPIEFEGFIRGNAIKYLARYKDKEGLKDVLKAQHYIAKLVELITPKDITPKDITPTKQRGRPRGSTKVLRKGKKS
jgi:hypothetical protein